MKTFTYTIKDELGIHARPAGLLVKAAAPFQSKITLDTGTKTADARRIMALMSLGAKKDSCITVTVDGPDEDTAAQTIESFFKENL